MRLEPTRPWLRTDLMTLLRDSWITRLRVTQSDTELPHNLVGRISKRSRWLCSLGHTLPLSLELAKTITLVAIHDRTPSAVPAEKTHQNGQRVSTGTSP
jgi:hypothetical protein